jgi:hypothetical protein
MSDTIEVFISYSKQDKDLRDGLLAHLRPLEREGIITWYDRQILPGTEWDEEIKARLNTADIILLLVSADFLATDYCIQVEIPEALRRHEAGEATVMPVILRHCAWKHTPLAKIQAYPEKAKPIKGWADIDEAYTNVVDGVYLAATEIKKRRGQESTTGSNSYPNGKVNLPILSLKELQECDSAKILFIKNVKDPQRWAYSLERMEQPESRAFELMWRSGSHGVNLPQSGDLMVLHQRAKVTHVVEFVDDQVRQTDSGFFRWVRAVWLAEQDWNQLPHQKDVLGFSPNYADGNTHSLNSPNFSTFREAWSSLEEFQKYIFKRLTQSQLTVNSEDILVSEKGMDYTRLRELLKAGKWKEADQETARKMCEVMGRQEEVWLPVGDIEQFPCADLRTIDQLWVKYSNGRFGFSIQKEIWQKCGIPTNKQRDRFAEEVGWKEEGISTDSNWKSYPEYTFDVSARRGHLPSFLCLGGWDGRRIRFEDTRIADKWTVQAAYGMLVYDSVSSLARRLIKCSI